MLPPGPPATAQSDPGVIGASMDLLRRGVGITVEYGLVLREAHRLARSLHGSVEGVQTAGSADSRAVGEHRHARPEQHARGAGARRPPWRPPLAAQPRSGRFAELPGRRDGEAKGGRGPHGPHHHHHRRRASHLPRSSMLPMPRAARGSARSTQLHTCAAHAHGRRDCFQYVLLTQATAQLLFAILSTI